MNAPMNDDHTAYVVTDRYSGQPIELYPEVDGGVAIVVIMDSRTFLQLFVPAHALVRAAVAAALEALELTHPQMSSATRGGQHDPIRSDHDREQEN